MSPLRKLRFLVFLQLLVAWSVVSVYAVTPLKRSRPAVSESAAFVAEGIIIDSIEIRNQNIYNVDDERYSGFLFRMANRLHAVTRSQIIRRELLFKAGQPFSQEIADETARNLRARFPFNDAWIEVEPIGDDRVLVRVVTVDQWSLIGGLRSIRREGSETDYRLGFEERNFLGRAQLVSLDYFIEENEGNYVTSTFRESRIYGRPYSLQLDFSSNPKGRLKRFALGHPFYNLAQKFAFAVAVSDTGGRQERISSRGDPIAEWQNRGDQADLEVVYRWGPYHRKTAVIGGYKYLSQQTSDRKVLNSYPPDSVQFPMDSVYHEFDVGFSYALQNFIVVRRINGFSYNEDVALGASVAVTYGRAFMPEFDDYHYDFVKAGAALTQRVGWSIFSLEYTRSFWFKHGNDSRRLSRFGLSFYNNGLSCLTVAMRSSYISSKSEDLSPLVLGGKNGLRGYRAEFTSGDRVHVVNLEGRFFPGIELLSVKIGAAVFSDLGRTWQSGEPVRFRFRDYYSSVGVGLRFSLERWTRAELVRVDIAYVQEERLELSVETGQYF